MKVAIYNKAGEKKSDLTLSKRFDDEVSNKAVTLYINYLRNALRAPIANTKDRGQVSGGGKKPWRQKGTGNARVGSTRSPLWVGGGVTFGPTSARNFQQRINKGLKKQIIAGIIGEYAKNKKLFILDDLSFEKPSTKAAEEMLAKIKTAGKVSVIAAPKDEFSYESFRNLPYVTFMAVSKPNMIAVSSSQNLFISKEAAEILEKNLEIK